MAYIDHKRILEIKIAAQIKLVELYTQLATDLDIADASMEDIIDQDEKAQEAWAELNRHRATLNEWNAINARAEKE